MGRRYQVHEFAELAGVTVRALHHYDRLDLLRPRRRTRAGYRLYEDCDLERLEQIVTLKFLGLDLKQIKALLNRDGHDLADALRRQRCVLEEKRRLLDSAIAAIHEAELAVEPGERLALLRKIITAIEGQGQASWMMRYYQDDETRVKLRARQRLWSPQLQARTERDWADLIRDVEDALGEDPASEAAQVLATRWIRLIEAFPGSDPQMAASVKALYADRENWPPDFQCKVTPFRQEVCDFIARAVAARKC
jgi:MerR family transcriptional regulator, thiopeptide resistance regulator